MPFTAILIYLSCLCLTIELLEGRVMDNIHEVKLKLHLTNGVETESRSDSIMEKKREEGKTGMKSRGEERRKDAQSCKDTHTQVNTCLYIHAYMCMCIYKQILTIALHTISTLYSYNSPIT